MQVVRVLERKMFSRLIPSAAVLGVVLLFASWGIGQAKPAGTGQATPAPDAAVQELMNKYPGLLPEFGHVIERIQKEVKTPAERTQSRLLPLMPQSTIFYAALPNYGDAAHQAMAIFHEELEQSAVLRSWWHQGDMAKMGPKIDESVEKFYEVSQYLGDEVVISASVSAAANSPEEHNFLVIAEARKPGLKEILPAMFKDVAEVSKSPVRVLDVNELASARDTGPSKNLVVLVRPDYVVASLDVAALRAINARLDRKDEGFQSTPFGQRILQGYAGGMSAVAALDVRAVLMHLPKSTEANEKTFRNTGFADMKYLVWAHKTLDEHPSSEMELSFTGPRHGMASWLGAPGPMGSLDFVSPNAVIVAALRLKNPPQMFDEIRALSMASNPKAFEGVEQMERGLGVSLRDDMLARLTGEIAFELDSLDQTKPEWKILLRVDDPQRMQAVLGKLLAMAPVNPQYSEEDGVGYHTLEIPNPQKPVEVAYAFVDGYLIFASGREKIRESVRMHREGASLSKSAKFSKELPSGGPQVSALFYEDAVAVSAMSLRRIMPQVAESLKSASANSGGAAVVRVYGEESALRVVSHSAGADAGAVLVGAAIAIPNLMKARLAANDSSAVGMIRTANTAQVTYATSYPDRGYARDLARLGPNPTGSTMTTVEHAGLIDASLGNPKCGSGVWCTKAGYKFALKGVCIAQKCTEYVVAATPESGSTGTKSFCSTSDAVIRFKVGEPLMIVPTVGECKRWAPVQ